MTEDKPHLSLVPTDGEPSTDSTPETPPALTPGDIKPIPLSDELMKAHPWARPFIEAYRKSMGASVSAAAAGVDRTTPYHLEKRNPEFAAAWEEARRDAADMAQAMLYKRGMSHSDANLRFLVTHHTPERYRPAKNEETTPVYRVVIMDEGPAPPHAWIGEPIDAEYVDTTPGERTEANGGREDPRRADGAGTPDESGGDLAQDAELRTPADADDSPDRPSGPVG